MKKKNLLVTAIAIFGLATITMAQTIPSYVPTNGLVGWWPFNGNANDESGNGNNGTVNGATLTVDRNGAFNSAFSFDGLSNYISGNIANFSNTSITSLSAWVKYIGDAGGQPYDLFFQYGTYGSHTFAYSYNYFGQNIDFYSQCFTNPYSSVNLQNNWHYIVVVDSLQYSKIYIDGAIFNNSVSGGNGNCYQGTNYFLIGGGADNQFTTGSLDDIAIWNRALTQQEITDLYNGCQLSVNTQPTNQTININNNAQFVVGSSDPGATYQWQTDLGVGLQNLNSVGQYSGTTDDTLTVSNVTMSNNNQPFRCIISSGSCSDTSNVAVLTVNNNVGINETLQDNLFSVFPNPAQSVINVKADGKLIGSFYSIYDNTGRVVLSGKLNAESTTIELGNLSGGIYMFSVGENMKQSFKVIKE